MSYETVIGLEVHVQLKTRSKAFCSCSTNFGAPPNSQTCPVCLGFPGSLPVLNREALRLSAKVAIALDCKISKKIRFDRKNYFYPDLPKAYQISQFSQPLSEHGHLSIFIENKEKGIRIKRVHLEEDTGKLFHQTDYSLIDFNRSGVPLLEIVSEPDISSPEEAHMYLTQLKSILEYTEVSDCNMEEGSLRCDANISVRKSGSKELGVKTEIKNMNSFKAVKAALELERDRQVELLERGGKVIQETRLYDATRNVTESMRSKEEAHDYRYFPEPDLVPFDFDEGPLKQIMAEIPELPEPKKKRFIKEHNLSEYDAGIMAGDRRLADYFEKCVSLCKKPKDVANWLMGDISFYMKEHNITIKDLNLKTEHLAGMLGLIGDGVITGKVAKDLLIEMIETGKSPDALVKDKGLEQIKDTNFIEDAVSKVIEENQKIVGDYKAGKKNAIMALVGKVMAATKGKLNPGIASEILRRKLGG